MTTRLSFALLCVLAFLATCKRTEAQKNEPEVQRLREAWYDFEFGGSKVGFIKAIDERTQVNGRPAYHLHRRSELSVKRQNEAVKITSVADTWFAPDGTPMRFVNTRSEGAEQRKVEGYRDGQEVVIRQTVGRTVRERRFPLTDDLRWASSLEILLAERLKVGTKMKGQIIDESEGDVLPYTLEVVSVEEDIYTIEQVAGPIRARIKMAADGTVLDVVLPDLNARQKKVTEAQARRPSDAVDLFSAALFRMPAPLPDRDSIDVLVVQLSSKAGKALDVVADHRQTVKKVGSNAELSIRVQASPSRPPIRPVTGKKWQPFLRSTEYEPLEDEGLKAVVERVAAGKKTVWDAARAINAFVYTHIENKSLARAYMSAPEALASKEGDCTEHAVLFSALAKIAGIPTRLVTGLVYVGGPENVFGYHEWVEIWSGEEWLAMDPTFGQDIADATHIKLHAGLSDAAGRRLAGKVAAGAIGDLQIEPVAYVDADGQRRAL